MYSATAWIYYMRTLPLSNVTKDWHCECSVNKGAVCPRHNTCLARCGMKSLLMSIDDKTAVDDEVPESDQ